MQAPTFRAYVRRELHSYRQPYVWQLRQPFYPTTANGLNATRPAAMRDIIRDARHFQTIHEDPSPRKG